MSVFIATGRVLIRCSHHNVQLGRSEDPLVSGWCSARLAGWVKTIGRGRTRPDENLRLMGHGV